MSLLNWFNRARTTPPGSPTWPHAQPEAGPVEFAFESGGRAYFRFVSTEALPVLRFNAAQDHLLELTYRTSREYLAALYDAVLVACNQGKMAEIAVVITEAKRRLDWITDVGLLFKLATCYYFTTDEDPARYDSARAAQHMAHWRTHERDLPAFFFKTRLTSLLPSADFVAASIQTYTTSTARLESAQLNAFLLLLSDAPNGQEQLQRIRSQVATLNDWTASIAGASLPGTAGLTPS